MELYKHQQDILTKNPPKYLLAWGTGSGKTYAALELAKKNKTTALIICPKSIKQQWIENAGQYNNEHKVVTKEEFRKYFKEIEAYDALIIDEFHYFAGMKSKMSKNLLKYIKKHSPTFIWGLTATPYLSTPWNIYQLARILGHHWHYWEFERQFFYRVDMGGKMVPMIKSGIEEEIAELVGRIGESVSIEECSDIPNQYFYTEEFSLNNTQSKTITQEKKKDELNPVSFFTRKHQIENGTLKSDGYSENKYMQCDKNERIYELCQANNKIAIVTRYNLHIDQLYEKLQKLNKPIYVIRGDTQDRHNVVTSAEEDNTCIVLINSHCSEGYELPSIGMCVFASLSFSYKDYKQMIGRFLRINKLKKNVFIHLLTKGGIDEAVYASIQKKQDFDIAIYANSNR